MHVLVGFARDELAARDVGREPAETVEHRRQVVVSQQAGLVQHPGMGLGRAHVVRGQHPVEVGGFAQRRHGGGRSGFEPAAPEGSFVGAVSTHT